MSYTKFRGQVEHQLAKHYSREEETILVDYNDAILYGRRLQALEMGRLIGLGRQALNNWLSSIRRSFQSQRVMTTLYKMDDRLLKDIGVSRSEILAVAKRGYVPHRRRPPVNTPSQPTHENFDEAKEAA